MSEPNGQNEGKRLGRAARRRRIRESNCGEVISDAKFKIFREWLKSSGFPKAKLTLANFGETGRGMMATKDIEEGEIIVSVPEKYLMTHRSLSKVYYGTDHSLNSHQLLALHVALQRRLGPRSSWRPYIDMLPVDFDTVAVTFEERLGVLLPRCVQEEVGSQRSKIQADYACVSEFLKMKKCPLPSSSSILTYKEFEWAWLCVNTRCIFLDTKNDVAKGGNIALAPMLDFLNHTWEAQIQSGFDEATKCYQIRTLIPYKKGQQVFINYGPHDNYFILKEYGFVISRNPYNYVSLDDEFLELNVPGETDEAREQKIELLKARGFFGDYTIHCQNDISFRLLCALRLRLLASFDSRRPVTYAAWEKVVMGERELVDERNERGVYECLGIMCERVVARAGVALEMLSDHSFARLPALPVMFVRQIWEESKDIAIGVLTKYQLARLDGPEKV